jgi:hypothetical protein
MNKRFLKGSTLLLAGLCLPGIARAQPPSFPSLEGDQPQAALVRSTVLCPGFKSDGGPGYDAPVTGFRNLKQASSDTQNEILRIVRSIGIEHPIIAYTSDDEDVARAGAVAAVIGENDNWAIIYSEKFLKSLLKKSRSSWAIFSVLAHEAGHHFNQATSTKVGGKATGSTPDREKEADYFSGFILKGFGASLKDAQLAIATEESDDAPPSKTHPPKNVRLSEIQRGWEKAAAPKVVTQKVEVPAAGNENTKGGVEENGTITVPPRRTPEGSAEPNAQQAKVDCMHRMPCSHQIACVHLMPCVHPVPCTHIQVVNQNVDCVHLGPCVHTLPNGLPEHIADRAHLFDTVSVPVQEHPQGDGAHAADAMHIADLLHFMEGDPQHPEGHMVTMAAPRAPGAAGFLSSDEGIPAPINLNVLHLDDDAP